MLGDGYRTFVEVSPHPVLTIGVQEAIDEASDGLPDAVALGSLRRDEPAVERFLMSLSEIWACGSEVDWEGLFAGAGGQRAKLPTYAFQRERFWLQGEVGAGDVGSIGLSSSAHPLLGAMVDVAAGEQWLFTGGLSAQKPGWLADHMVFGRPVVPGTAFLELALHAGSHVDCGVLEEFVIQAPLVLAPEGMVALQVSVGEPDGSGRRSVSVSTRRAQLEDDDGLAREPWTCSRQRHPRGRRGLRRGAGARDRARGDARGGGVAARGR